jgi:hypothetical protein
MIWNGMYPNRVLHTQHHTTMARPPQQKARYYTCVYNCRLTWTLLHRSLACILPCALRCYIVAPFSSPLSSHIAAMVSAKYSRPTEAQIKSRVAARYSWILHLVVPRVPLCTMEAVSVKARITYLRACLCSMCSLYADRNQSARRDELCLSTSCTFPLSMASRNPGSASCLHPYCSPVCYGLFLFTLCR